MPFGLGYTHKSLLTDRLTFVRAREWQRVILLPGSKLKGLRHRFGAGAPPNLSFPWQTLWFPSGSCLLRFAENQIQGKCFTKTVRRGTHSRRMQNKGTGTLCFLRDSRSSAVQVTLREMMVPNQLAKESRIKQTWRFQGSPGSGQGHP